MTVRVVVSCDAVHPCRTPPACRAFLATSTPIADLAYEEAEEAGWTQDVGNVDRCPSCSRSAAADSFATPTPDPWVEPGWPDLEPAF